MNDNNKYLITSALPYVNNILHIGHMVGCFLPSDVYARFCRSRGRDVLFVCGADMHGTAAEIGAMREKMSVLDYTNKYAALHRQSMIDFNMSFDLYGSTHTDLHTKLVQSLFTRLDNAGLIEERTTKQSYSVKDEMFLADRFVIGTCPKCGNESAYGNECPKCGATLEPGDLRNPHSAITPDSPVEMRETKHLYFKLSAMTDKLSEWINSRVGWPNTAMKIAQKWLSEGLRDTPITRDLKWGIPVNKPGYENKVFYVWFDAPWGYVSISQAANKNWEQWWKNDNCHYTQFMGKDNVAFHAVFFPAQELAMNDNWKTVDVLKALNFLNFEGAKISKSTGNGVFLNDAINDAPSDAWRYALMASAPETDDTDFTLQRFADIVNKDLNGMLGNFVSRVCKLTEKNFGNTVPVGTCRARPGECDSPLQNEINSKLAELTTALDACEFRDAITALRGLWAIGNEFFTKMEPWALIKESEKLQSESENSDTDMDTKIKLLSESVSLSEQAGAALNECFQLINFYASVSHPFIPDAAAKMRDIFATNNLQLTTNNWPAAFERRIKDGTEFIVPENLFNRIDDDKLKAMGEKYSKQKPMIVIAKILTADPHPDSDHLKLCTVDAGDDKPIQIVCGAPNARAGLTTVLARVGAKLPTFEVPLAARKVRGILSNGMLCASDELGIGDDHDGILELPDDAKIGDEFKIK